MRLVVLLLVLGSLLGYGAPARAQDQNRPFIKISHVGAEETPVFGLFISTRASVLDEKLELVPGYRAEPVYLVRPGEFAHLLKLSQTAATGPLGPGCRHRYGTLRITINDGHTLGSFLIEPIDNSLEFINDLLAIMARYKAANRRDPTLWDAAQVLRGQLSI